ncbi:protein GVQW3-like [Eupeodes corollae]|uniref:protein GVQW3-like n=1 Tax=Eupeodes corollae TaxID=290404 RepID=UPI002490B9D0|nr:protein GVQW3-like [Eupeodes corollae]
MEELKSQRICKFCVLNDLNCNNVCEMLQKAYGESAMKKTSVYEWYKRFQDGREHNTSIIIDENMKKVEKMVINDRRITIREVADKIGISNGSSHNIFSYVLGMKRVAAKFIPKLLNFEQENNLISIAQDLLNDVNDDPSLLERVITGDETWVYGYDVETKSQSSTWKHPTSPRA